MVIRGNDSQGCQLCRLGWHCMSNTVYRGDFVSLPSWSLLYYKIKQGLWTCTKEHMTCMYVYLFGSMTQTVLPVYDAQGHPKQSAASFVSGGRTGITGITGIYCLRTHKWVWSTAGYNSNVFISITVVCYYCFTVIIISLHNTLTSLDSFFLLDISPIKVIYLNILGFFQ